MHWSPRIEQALYRAAKLHEGLFRKGPDRLPALVHLVGVASIVSEHTDDEDTVVAALLHDSIEDTSYTPENLREEFGERVMGIVLGVTIPEMHEGKETGVWSRDRRRYFENLSRAPMESVLVAAADKIHNFTTIIRDYMDNTEGFKRDFTGTKEDRLKVYGSIAELIVDRLGPDHPLSEELSEVWKKYEAFVMMAL
ncbi:MAG: bifunctional (p)ppGpp synthetase/guanosine-3',5'-bis(diphosphate) 3'-pyrophosphohydrolase [Candidatus Pacebacteria bacterium]|nr:bifunctional (p)ppGpp synthetase/guanosine-3',5'-bis(diphosphate) 3'-pyrophosphohydrolase [Candidatus Paceibacterota bacterium]